MTHALLSRYRPRYLRSLAYMLQASEYFLADYLAWYHRTSDFSRVERRHKLKPTPKSNLVLIILYLLSFGLAGLALSAPWLWTPPWSYLAVLIGLLLVPFVVPYAITLPLFLVQVLVQKPIEARMVRRARERLRQHPATKIAIAGSYGKTSMREVLRTILSEGKRVAAPPHSYNTPAGISRFIDGLAGDEEVLIFELGEYYPGDVKKLCALVEPHIGVITGVNEAHLRKFKNLHSTTETIFELAAWLKDKPVYVNGESELAQQRALSGHMIYTRDGLSGATSWQVKQAHTDLGGTTATFIHDGTELPATTHLLGLHQIGPLVAAADLATRLGLTSKQIQRGIAATKPFDHRLEPKTDATGVTILDDSYNGNPNGVKVVIEFLAGLKGHRRFYVTPGLVEMGRRTQAVHREIGYQLAKAQIEQVILIRNSVTPHIADGLTQAGYQGQLTWFDDGPTALAALPYLTVKGDIVLLQNDWPDQYA